MLILNVVRDRMIRIEVGYGLEGALTDIETAKIRREYMNPYLQQGDYNGGLLKGYIAVVNEVAGEYGVSMEAISEKLSADSRMQYFTANTGRTTGARGRRFRPDLCDRSYVLVVDGVFFSSPHILIR